MVEKLMLADLIFKMLHKETNQFHIQNKLHLSGLLLLAAFLEHSGDPYKRSGVQMDLARFKMAASGCTAHKDVCYEFLFILASLCKNLAHNLAYAFLLKFSK